MGLAHFKGGKNDYEQFLLTNFTTLKNLLSELRKNNFHHKLYIQVQFQFMGKVIQENYLLKMRKKNHLVLMLRQNYYVKIIC